MHIATTTKQTKKITAQQRAKKPKNKKQQQPQAFPAPQHYKNLMMRPVYRPDAARYLRM